MAWTLLHAEADPAPLEQTLDAWGLERVTISRVNQSADALRFTEVGAAYDTAPTFAFDDTLTLFRDGVPVFEGRVLAPRRTGSPAGEGREYTVAGPWSWLEQIVYQQIWHTTAGADDTLVEVRRSRIVVGQDKLGAKIDTSAEMIAAVQWAIDNGAPITIGTIDAGVTIPYAELVDVTVAELIRHCLRWTPDAAAWFDYSGDPYPIFHIRRRASLAPVTIAIEPTQLAQIDIRSREDILVPAVALKYERSHTYNGETWSTTEVDVYPPLATGSEPRAVVATIDLEGSAANVEEQLIETESIDETSKSWWKKHVRALAGHLDAQLTIIAPTVLQDDGSGGLEASGLSKYIVSGSIQDWMTGVTAREVVVSAKITYTGTDFPAFAEVPFSVSLQGTDAAHGRYTRVLSSTAAEATPVGLAEALYNALSVLHWQGEYVVAQDEVTGLATPGNTLRLTGGLAAWATMDAMIQQVVEDIDSGDTRLVFGPPEHLSPQDLVELLRANRQRRPSYYLNERATGQKAASGGLTSGAQKTLRNNTTIAPSAGGGLRFIVVSYTPSGAFPVASEIVTAIQSRYAALTFTPADGDVLIVGTGSKSLHYLVAPTPGLFTNGFRVISITVSPVTKRAVQIGPKGFW